MTQVFIIYFLSGIWISVRVSFWQVWERKQRKDVHGVYIKRSCTVLYTKRSALCCGYCDCMNLINLMGLLGKRELGKGDWREIKQLLWVREKAVRPLRVMHR